MNYICPWELRVARRARVRMKLFPGRRGRREWVPEGVNSSEPRRRAGNNSGLAGVGFGGCSFGWDAGDLSTVAAWGGASIAEDACFYPNELPANPGTVHYVLPVSDRLPAEDSAPSNVGHDP